MSHGPLAVYDQCDGKMNAELDDWVVGELVFWRAACMSACLPAGLPAGNIHNSNATPLLYTGVWCSAGWWWQTAVWEGVPPYVNTQVCGVVQCGGRLQCSVCGVPLHC